MLSEEQLKYYVKMLNEQIKDLKEEDYLIKHSGPNAGFYYQFCGNPKQMDQKFAREQALLKEQLTELQKDLREFEEDPKRLRTFLKHYQLDDGMGDFF